MGRINREDMLELTRRMTLSRNCFHRIAGAYFEGGGYLDGTFNTHFQKLSVSEQSQKLKIAKVVPFARTNEDLKEYRFAAPVDKPGSTRKFLETLLDSELKNDALMEVFYEMFGETYRSGQDYGIFFFLGKYDIPCIGTDKIRQWESENVYRFVLCTVCPVSGDYEPGEPDCGFLYPAYRDRGGVIDCVDVYHAGEHPELLRILGVSADGR